MKYEDLGIVKVIKTSPLVIYDNDVAIECFQKSKSK